MAPDPVSQERIYQAIKDDFLAGSMLPGVRLEIQAIATRHRTSTTPVREVLHRLIGERLIEPRPEGGLRIAIPDAQGLKDLYAWNSELVVAAVRMAPTAAVRDVLRSHRVRDLPRTPLRAAIFVSGLFLAMARATANAESIAAIDGANERLHYPRLREDRVFSDLQSELGVLVQNGRIDIRRAFIRRVRSYHRRRGAKAQIISGQFQ